MLVTEGRGLVDAPRGMADRVRRRSSRSACLHHQGGWPRLGDRVSAANGLRTGHPPSSALNWRTLFSGENGNVSTPDFPQRWARPDSPGGASTGPAARRQPTGSPPWATHWRTSARVLGALSADAGVSPIEFTKLSATGRLARMDHLAAQPPRSKQEGEQEAASGRCAAGIVGCLAGKTDRRYPVDMRPGAPARWRSSGRRSAIEATVRVLSRFRGRQRSAGRDGGPAWRGCARWRSRQGVESSPAGVQAR